MQRGAEALWIERFRENYERVARGFKALNENTALYLPIVENGVKGILMIQLFRKIKFLANGEVEFIFSEDAAPYVFALRSQFFSFKLAELAQIKSKYAIILMKLWKQIALKSTCHNHSRRFRRLARLVFRGREKNAPCNLCKELSESWGRRAREKIRGRCLSKRS